VRNNLTINVQLWELVTYNLVLRVINILRWTDDRRIPFLIVALQGCDAIDMGALYRVNMDGIGFKQQFLPSHLVCCYSYEIQDPEWTQNHVLILFMPDRIHRIRNRRPDGLNADGDVRKYEY
jgi:hypothetical protein